MSTSWRNRPTAGARWLAAALMCGLVLPVTRAAAQPKKPPPAAPLTEEQQVVQAIEKTLQRHGPEVHRCFEQALADRIDVAGKVEVEVEVAAGGKIAASKIVSKGAEMPPQLSACVLASAALWTIEGVEAGASLVLPFSFQGQMNQFVVKTADAPERGPAAAKGKAGAGSRAAPPFMVKILADEANVRAQQASLTLLTVGPASRVALHRHPRSAKILYVLKGHARLLGPPGSAPERLDEGTALYLPPGYPHAIENMGRQAPVMFLQAFNPPGPERVYRDPASAEARADFEVIRDPGKIKLPAGDTPGSRLVFVAAAKAPPLPIPGSKGLVRIVLDQAVTGSPAFGLSVIEFAPGSEVPRHSHPGAEEFLYVLSGGGTLTVGSESMPFGPDQTIHIPADQPHASKVGPGEPTVAVQIYAPAGPEQRFRASKPASELPIPSKVK